MSSRSSESESNAASAERIAAFALKDGAERRLSAVWEGFARPRVMEVGAIARRSKASLSKTLRRGGREIGLFWDWGSRMRGLSVLVMGLASLLTEQILGIYEQVFGSIQVL